MGKQRKKLNNKKIIQKDTEKQKYLKYYLIEKGYTLKDLKCEVILMICDMLIDNYIKSEYDCNNELLLDNIALSDRDLVLNTSKELQKDIQYNILTIDKLQSIINAKNENKQALIRSILVNSSYYFYNYCAENLKSSVLMKTTNENKIKWIPDLICFSLIQEMIERNYHFNKFTFINKCDLEKIFSIYNKTNILIKKRDNISFLSKEKTIIDNMMDVAEEIVDKLIKSIYK